MVDDGQRGHARVIAAAAPARRMGREREREWERGRGRERIRPDRGRCWGLSHAEARADKSRAYAIALCECCEASAAIEIAGALGACSAADVHAVVALGTRAKNILSRLVR